MKVEDIAGVAGGWTMVGRVVLFEELDTSWMRLESEESVVGKSGDKQVH